MFTHTVKLVSSSHHFWVRYMDVWARLLLIQALSNAAETLRSQKRWIIPVLCRYNSPSHIFFLIMVAVSDRFHSMWHFTGLKYRSDGDFTVWEVVQPGQVVHINPADISKYTQTRINRTCMYAHTHSPLEGQKPHFNHSTYDLLIAERGCMECKSILW